MSTRYSRLIGIGFTVCLGLLATNVEARTQFFGPLRELVDSANDTEPNPLSDENLGYLVGLPDHAVALLNDAVEGGRIATAAHLATLLSLEESPEKLESLLADNCILCHSNVEFHEERTLLRPRDSADPSHMDLTDVVDDVHFRQGLSCAGCHGGDPAGFMDHDHPDEWPYDAEARGTDRKWVPQFCARCHGDASFMRRYAPGLPTDQLAKYKESRHGERLLEDGDSRAAECTNCHGVHGIRKAENPRSTVYAKNIADTCGTCHSDSKLMSDYVLADGTPLPTDQVEKYRNSVHGIALFEHGDLGAATCNDCHGDHAATPPGVASVSQICRECHADKGSLFDGSRHKTTFERHGWPECGACHGNHDIQPTSDEMLGAGPDSMCVTCHDKYAAHNPECRRTAKYFHEIVTELRLSLDDFEERSLDLAERGLDVEAMGDAIRELDDALKTSRAYIHTFNVSDFDVVADRGRATIETLSALVDLAEREYEIRRRGLFVVISLTLLLALVLYLKLRSFERARKAGEERD